MDQNVGLSRHGNPEVNSVTLPSACASLAWCLRENQTRHAENVAASRGIRIRKEVGGHYTNVITLAPSLDITNADIDLGANALKQVRASAKASLYPQAAIARA